MKRVFAYRGISIAVTVMLLSAGCHTRDTLDNRVNTALRLAGENRVELKKVIEHYGNDDIKLQAARFLIANMPGHYSYTDTLAVSRFYDSIDSLISRLRGIDNECLRDSIVEFERRYDNTVFAIKPDLEIVSADFLIHNIDQAFDTWHKSPYCRHLDFEDFCEYILPYKSNELQALDDWRGRFSNMFSDSLELTRSCSSFANSSFRATETFNHCLIDSFNPESANISKPRLPYRLSTQLSIPFGTCDDYCRAAMPLFRSAGIPVMNDYVPRWGYAASSHGWLVVKAQTGKEIPFVPFYGTPKEQHKIDETKAKVYRRTYSSNQVLADLNNSGEWVPRLFRNIFQSDVTHEYVTPHSITVNIHNTDNRYAYLAVSRHTGWEPVAFTKVKGDKATFNDLGAGCVYMPVLYDNTGRQSFPSNPIFLDLDGSVRKLEPHVDVTISAKLFRKSPLLEYAWNAAVAIDNSCIEASDSRDFKGFIQAGKISTPPDRGDEITVPDTIGSRRYWRFVKRGDKASCYVAELAFFERGTNKRLYGEVFQYPPSDDFYAPLIRTYLFDNNMLQGFYADGTGEVWVGIDFGRPVEIDRIQYTPRADGNMIEPGDEYELFYWNRDNWESLGRKTATTVSIDYNNIPSNALLLLRDLTKGHEERIFTLTADGKQVFH